MSESFGAKVAALKRAAANAPRPTAQAPLKPAQARTNLKRVAPEFPKIIEDNVQCPSPLKKKHQKRMRTQKRLHLSVA